MMNVPRDPEALRALVQQVDERDQGGIDGWIEQTDEDGRVRVLVGSAVDLDIEGTPACVIQVKLSGHWTSPIYYVFERKAHGDGFGRTAHYILSHQEPRTNRQWFCAAVKGCVPHVGVYRGDFGLVGARFREGEPARA